MTISQKRTIDKMEYGREYSAYQLQESLSTLHSLIRLGFLSKRAEMGSGFSPRTGFKFIKLKIAITPKGGK